LTLLVGRQEEQLACKKLSGEVLLNFLVDQFSVPIFLLPFFSVAVFAMNHELYYEDFICSYKQFLLANSDFTVKQVNLW